MANYLNTDVLVKTDWVMQHLKDPAVRIVECDTNPLLYEQGHIPGALRLDCQKELVDESTRDCVGRAAFEAAASRLGIGSGTNVVFYGDQHNIMACYAYWVFRMYGHAHLRALDGGRDAWVRNGLSLVQDVPAVAPTKFRASEHISEFRARREDVLQLVGHPEKGRERGAGRAGGVIVDDRTAAEFRGEFNTQASYPPRFRRAGHIPGAQNVPWTELLEKDGTFRRPDEINRLLEGHGITPDKSVVVYTRIGERSSLTWFVLHEMLGFPNVRNYDGSWTEWGNMVGMPIEGGRVVPVPPGMTGQRATTSSFGAS